MVPVMTVSKFERFFRAAAGLDVDKKDLKRYSDFVNQKTYDLLLRGRAAATDNGRDIIQPSDLPVTKGLQESMHEFRKLDEAIELTSILEYIAELPPLNVTYSTDTEAELPRVRETLEAKGVSRDDVEAVLGGNARRVLRDGWR